MRTVLRIVVQTNLVIHVLSFLRQGNSDLRSIYENENMIPIFAWKNYRYFKINNYPIKGVLSIQRQHLSFSRICDIYSDAEFEEAMKLPEYEPWENRNQEENIENVE
ncbi:unnamed protein product [Caenorhabditis angaria]|uniref:Uncharacterized protein n=1 Tax=Caenorhabditis angaria TaxID=860376 RepID=A0A9P1ID95_9PELO|nr:unnamed protein product [Caenorhabditis angaria]